MADATACEVYTGFPPRLIWPSDVRARKTQLAADLLAANIAATTCKGLDPALLAQWSAFYAAAYDWSQSDTSVWGAGGQMDQEQSYECALYAWQQKLAATQCQIVSRGNPDPAGQGATGESVKWLGVAVASVAGAYVVGQIAHLTLEALQLVPKRKA